MRALGVAALLCVGLASGSLMTAGRSSAEDFSKPFLGFAPANTVLRESDPASAGLSPAPIDEAIRQIRAWETPPGRRRCMPGPSRSWATTVGSSPATPAVRR